MSDRADHDARRGIKTSRPRAERAEAVERISMKSANALLDLAILGINPHYLGETHYRGDIAFSNERRDAVTVFRPPISAAFNRALPGCLELSRLWRDDYRKAPVSRFLLASLRALRELKPSCPVVVAYTDPTGTDTRDGRPHTGAVYLHSGFVHVGEAPAAEPHWLKEDGKRISAASVYKLLGTKARDAVAAARPDWTYVRGKPKAIFMIGMAMSVDDAVAALERLPRAARTRPFNLTGSKGPQHL